MNEHNAREDTSYATGLLNDMNAKFVAMLEGEPVKDGEGKAVSQALLDQPMFREMLAGSSICTFVGPFCSFCVVGSFGSFVLFVYSPDLGYTRTAHTWILQWWMDG